VRRSPLSRQRQRPKRSWSPGSHGSKSGRIPCYVDRYGISPHARYTPGRIPIRGRRFGRLDSATDVRALIRKFRGCADVKLTWDDARAPESNPLAQVDTLAKCAIRGRIYGPIAQHKKWPANSRSQAIELISKSGAPGRIRTHDPLVRSQGCDFRKTRQKQAVAVRTLCHTFPIFARVTLCFAKNHSRPMAQARARQRATPSPSPTADGS
jgi:hypothetical protein